MDQLTTGIVIAVVSAVAGALATRLLEAKEKIVASQPHRFVFEQADAILITQAILIQNNGRKRADWIEIAHKSKPTIFKLWPALRHSETTGEDGQHLIRVESLGPKEYFYIEFLGAGALPDLQFVRSPAGHAQWIPIQLQRVFPASSTRILAVLVLLGIIQLILLGSAGIHFFLKLVNIVRQ